MSRARLPSRVCFLIPLIIAAMSIFAPGASGEVKVEGRITDGPIDSLLALPTWEPGDPESDIFLIPNVLIADPVGRPWILDRTHARVARLSADGKGRSFALGDGRGGRASTGIADLAASGAFLYLLDSALMHVALLDLDGFQRESVDIEPELDRAGYRGFIGSRILVGETGDFWIWEPRAARLLRLDRQGRFLDAPLSALAGSERPRRIADAALDPHDGFLLLDPIRGGILVLSATGARQSFEPLGGPLIEPASLACDGSGFRYVFESNGRLRIVQPGGTVVWDGSMPGTGPDGPRRCCIIDGDVLCAADAAHGTIRRWRIARRGLEDAKD
jgi:hypothetical protein